MKILIIGPAYEPDQGPAAPLFTLLCKRLAQSGHKVTIITKVPHYPTGTVPKEYRGKWMWKSREAGVDVIRIGLPSVNRSNLLQRFLQILAYQFRAAIVGLTQDYDIVLACNPFIGVLLPFAVTVVLKNKPAVYSVYDVYPDVGIKLGVFKNKFIIALVSAMERFCLSNSTSVHIISESFKPSLHVLGVEYSKMFYIPLWVDTDLIHPLPKDNEFTRENNLLDCFNVLYAGNLGMSQGLEIILDAAELLQNQQNICFTIIGEGPGRMPLINNAQKRQLKNIQFIPYQSRQRLAELLASADISLVILRRGIGMDSLPSKTFSIMASARPIVVSVDEESEISKLIKRANAGMWIPPEDPKQLSEMIIAIKNDPQLRYQLGKNGRTWVEQHHSPGYAAEQFEKLFYSAIEVHERSARKSM